MRILLQAVFIVCIVATPLLACSAKEDFFRASEVETIIACIEGPEGEQFLNSRSSELFTVLHLAVSADLGLEVLEAIRSAAADNWAVLRDRVDREGRSALHFAAKAPDNPDVVRWLLAWGADPDAAYAVDARLNPARYDLGITPLHLAAELPSGSNVVSALLAGGADPDIRRPPRETSWTAMHIAARYAEDTRLLIALGTGGASFKTTDHRGNGVLHIAAAWDRPPEVVGFLLEAGADANRTNSDDQLPIHLAARFATNPATVMLFRKRPVKPRGLTSSTAGDHPRG